MKNFPPKSISSTWRGWPTRSLLTSPQRMSSKTAGWTSDWSRPWYWNLLPPSTPSSWTGHPSASLTLWEPKQLNRSRLPLVAACQHFALLIYLVCCWTTPFFSASAAHHRICGCGCEYCHCRLQQWVESTLSVSMTSQRCLHLLTGVQSRLGCFESYTEA